MNNMFVKLKDIADLTVGYVGNMTKEYIETGVPFFRSLNIKPFYIDKSDLLYISSEFNEKIKKSKLMTGDLVIVRTGQPGTCCVVPQEFDGCNCSDLVIVRPDKKLVNPYYLEAYINFMAQKQINNHQVGAIQKHFNVGSAKEMLVYLPDRKKQEKIANLVRRINCKIDLNNKINTELESIAKTLYDYWFLQFEFPNEEGKPYKSSGGKMVWNEELKREIPEGWEIGNLYDIADFINGLACQKYRPVNDTEKLPVIKITEMHDGITDNTEFVRSDIPENNIINDGDILFSWSATLETMIWTGGKCGLNQHIFKVIPKNISKYYVFMQLSSYIGNFVKMAEARKTTMGHITTEHLKQSTIVLPNKTIAEMFDKKIFDVFQMIIKNNQEKRELINVRDFLLPLLMNGQVGFKE